MNLSVHKCQNLSTLRILEGLHTESHSHTNFYNLFFNCCVYNTYSRRLVTNDFVGEKLLVSGWGVADIQKPIVNSVLKAAYVTGISLIDCLQLLGADGAVKPI